MFCSQHYNRLSDEERSILDSYNERSNLHSVAKCELKHRLSSHDFSRSTGALARPKSFADKIDHQCHADYFKRRGVVDLLVPQTERIKTEKTLRSKPKKPLKKAKKPAPMTEAEEQQKLLRIFCRHLQHCDSLKEELQLAGGSSLVKAHLRSK